MKTIDWDEQIEALEDWRDNWWKSPAAIVGIAVAVRILIPSGLTYVVGAAALILARTALLAFTLTLVKVAGLGSRSDDDDDDDDEEDE